MNTADLWCKQIEISILSCVWFAVKKEKWPVWPNKRQCQSAESTSSVLPRNSPTNLYNEQIIQCEWSRDQALADGGNKKMWENYIAHLHSCSWLFTYSTRSCWPLSSSAEWLSMYAEIKWLISSHSAATSSDGDESTSNEWPNFRFVLMKVNYNALVKTIFE